MMRGVQKRYRMATIILSFAIVGLGFTLQPTAWSRPTTAQAKKQARPPATPRIAQVKSVTTSSPKTAKEHFDAGLKLYQQGKLDAALMEFRQAVKLVPTFAEAHLGIGVVLQAEAEHDMAITSFRRAITLDPQNANAYNNLGTALVMQGNYDEAITAYQKAIALNPKLVNAHTNLGYALGYETDEAGAIEAFQQAIRLNPNFAPAYEGMGIVFLKQGITEKGITQLKKAQTLYTQQGKLQEAEAVADTIRDANPGVKSKAPKPKTPNLKTTPVNTPDSSTNPSIDPTDSPLPR